MKQEWMTAMVVISSIVWGIFVGFNWYFWYIVLKEIIMLFPANMMAAYKPPNTTKLDNPLVLNEAVIDLYTVSGFIAAFPIGGAKDWRDYAVDNIC